MSTEVRAVIGTAGHVDHGKTTLVRTLTGIDTDRLAEEQSRGISIELGFAWLDLASGGRVAVVDVPGHERFVRQMIAGADGIDLVVLVVAADEGVMPQTREHLDICQLLGVGAGLIIITKTDLVEADWLELVEEDIRDAVSGTFLEDAPLSTFAAGDEAATARVREAIDALVTTAEQAGTLAARSEQRPFKLSVDRSFTMKGFGTIVTGTTASGRLATGDALQILPEGREGRVRGLQMHGEAVEVLTPGARAAINLQGIEHTDVHRGQVVSQPGGLRVTSMFDGTFRALERLVEPIADRAKVLVHIGTDQVEGTLALVHTESAAPGETVGVQVRLERPIAILPGEPFVARGFTVLEGYGKTLGGGRALTPQRRRYKGKHAQKAAFIEALSGDPAGVVIALATAEGEEGLSVAELPQVAPLTGPQIEAGVQGALSAGALYRSGERLFAAEAVVRLCDTAKDVIASYHEAHRARPGMVVDELRSRLRPRMLPELFALVLDALRDGGVATISAGASRVIALAGFEARRSAKQQAACEAIQRTLAGEGMTPTRVQDLPEALDLPPAQVTEALDLLTADGAVVRVSKDLAFDAEALADLQRRLVAYLQAEGTIDTGAFKEMTGASRKWTIPLGEYFDRIRLTLRVGDARRLRES